MLTFPSEETLVAPWRALAQLSHGAQVSPQGATVAAVFRSWAPLNNAILQGRAPADAAAAHRPRRRR